ncbi:MAG: hypothetical protein COU30_02725 [Candidatus Magasanikbacteria bacterium CG10_big_fil_rev_8_21_14_0_10_38_6]|uniref:DUF4012 domain-containing protein n=1 Tax=Candidatus Magasanikbacteria bacterium CG10_big_fil_rev_8_21_14_0_10_38_6 TaxID=1974647 RepID=A0A2M6P109_9BACT|nr:MAG: hypothetical protein COU30_02725 [Candidatus Magasanikbacteria bacterium CG10_big_fil_rev_8_21_14_0_10_38_6]
MQRNKRKKIYIFLGMIFFLLCMGVIVWTYQFVKHITPEQILENTFIQKQIKIGNTEKGISKDIFAQVPTLLGFDTPKTYLFLFLNNTELRPGGGFIGSYAVVQFDRGNPHILKVEGTETLDGNTPEDWKPTPPAPLAKYLGVDRWYFRDSNWSPDFAKSSEKTLELYRAEGGLLADNIDVVVGVTPSVLEEVIGITGPLTIDGITFDKEHLVETLEYEVEFGYRERGIPQSKRKDIISKVMKEIFTKLVEQSVKSLDLAKYLPVITHLMDEKHIILYAQDAQLQTYLRNESWTGETPTQIEGDYLQWVDANLAALKTDHAMKRSLNYHLEKQEQGTYLASATMNYTHTGVFDWRTSRYLTYARVFVPPGARISSAIIKNGEKTTIINASQIDQGEELGKKWFSTYYALEPGQQGSLTFIYTLPSTIATIGENGPYTLLIQKQLGTTANGLTLNLLFDKNIVGAEPSEEQEEWGNTTYTVDTDLTVDRKFTIQF